MARHVRGRKDNDFSRPGFPIVDYDNFTVVDLNATWRLVRQHALVVSVNNVFDAYYYEKIGYPLPGASFKAFYRVGF
jgi:vitamin B12 transporter